MSTTTALKVAGREVGPVRRSPGELVDTLIVGRDLELAELRAVIDRVQGRRRMSSRHGDPGGGKTICCGLAFAQPARRASRDRRHGIRNRGTARLRQAKLADFGGELRGALRADVQLGSDTADGFAGAHELSHGLSGRVGRRRGELIRLLVQLPHLNRGLHGFRIRYDLSAAQSLPAADR
jgi:hypothetical protein